MGHLTFTGGLFICHPDIGYENRSWRAAPPQLKRSPASKRVLVSPVRLPGNITQPPGIIRVVFAIMIPGEKIRCSLDRDSDGNFVPLPEQIINRRNQGFLSLLDALEKIITGDNVRSQILGIEAGRAKIIRNDFL